MTRGGEPVYLAALHYRHPTVAALSEKFDEVKWIAGNRGIVLPGGRAICSSRVSACRMSSGCKRSCRMQR